jgi:hypothetical protein
MTKGQIIAQIQLALGIEFHSRTIAAYIDQAFNQVVGQLFRQNPNQYDFYAKSYTIDVVQQCPTSYALLPVAIIQTPDNAQGIRQVYSTGENNLDFVPVPKFWFQLGKKLIAGKVMKQIGYFPKTDRIEFMNIPTAVTQVRAELVRPFTAYDDDEQVPLPDGSADMIIQMVFQMMNKEQVKTNIYKK